MPTKTPVPAWLDCGPLVLFGEGTPVEGQAPAWTLEARDGRTFRYCDYGSHRVASVRPAWGEPVLLVEVAGPAAAGEAFARHLEQRPWTAR